MHTQQHAGHVLGVAVKWSGGGGHALAIGGCAIINGTEYFEVDDPWYGKSIWSVSTFSTSYQGSGTWIQTCFTKPAQRPILQIEKKAMVKIKPILLNEEITRCIWEARPLLQLKYDKLREIKSPHDLSLALPHYVYTAGLDALTQERGLPEQPTALRVLEMQDEETVAFFDITTSQKSPQIRQMASTNPYLDLFNRGITAIIQWTIQTKSEAEAELRLLQVPALHFEALWLHYDDSAKDVFIPLRGGEELTALKVYPANDFLAELIKIAKAHPPMDDNLVGA